MALNYPTGMFLQAQQAQNQNLQDRFQNIASMGQSMGQFMQNIAEMKKQKALKDAITKMMSGNMAPGQPPTAGIDGAQTNQPTSQSDPVLSTLLPFMQADPSMAKEMLPAIARGEYMQHRPPKPQGATRDFGAELNERVRHNKSMEQIATDYHTQRQFIESLILKAQREKHADEVKFWQGRLADLDARNKLWYTLGFGTSPTEAAGFDQTGGGGGGDDPLGAYNQ